MNEYTNEENTKALRQSLNNSFYLLQGSEKKAKIQFVEAKIHGQLANHRTGN